MPSNSARKSYDAVRRCGYVSQRRDGVGYGNLKNLKKIDYGRLWQGMAIDR